MPPAVWLGSVRVLSENLPCYSRSTITRAVSNLEALGWIKTFDAGAQRTAYMVNKMVISDSKDGKRELISSVAETIEWQNPVLLEGGQNVATEVVTDVATGGNGLNHRWQRIEPQVATSVAGYGTQVVHNNAFTALETLETSETQDTPVQERGKDVSNEVSPRQQSRNCVPALTVKIGSPASEARALSRKQPVTKTPAKQVPIKAVNAPFHALDFAFLRTEDFAGHTPRDLQRLVYWGWHLDAYWGAQLREAKDSTRLANILKGLVSKVPASYHVSGAAYLQGQGTPNPRCENCKGVGHTIHLAEMYRKRNMLHCGKRVTCTCLTYTGTPWRDRPAV